MYHHNHQELSDVHQPEKQTFLQLVNDKQATESGAGWVFNEIEN